MAAERARRSAGGRLRRAAPGSSRGAWPWLAVASIAAAPIGNAGAAEPSTGQDEGASDRSTTVALGLMGLLGASFIDQPSDQSITVRGVRGRPMELADDAGFAGLSGGGGVAFELRAFHYFGLELDLLRSRDSGTAELTVNRLGTEHAFTLELADVAWHVPLLVKGVLPTEWVRPFVGLGPELVVPETAEAKVEGDLPYAVEYRAIPRSHLMLTAALGAELLLPIADADVRIPLQVRGSVTPAVGGDRDERARYAGADVLHVTRVEHYTRWQYQAAVTLGALVHF